MKHNTILSSFLLLFTALFFQSCMKDKCINTYTFTVQSPIYLSYDELRSSVALEGPREIKNPGKIYFKGQYLYVNELEKGIHVINNADPYNPVNTAFINIPGNVDIAIKENILYADSYIDLLAIDISNPGAVNVMKRIEDVFPYNDFGTYMADQSKGVVVGWIEEEVTETMDCDQYAMWEKGNLSNDVVFATGGVAGISAGGNSPSVGQGGSMARFTIVKDMLYTVDQNNLQLFDITSAANPNYLTLVNLGFGIETIFPYDNKLFIGTTSGMHIYDISNANSPAHLSTYAHITSCDPVVVEGDYAYVTLRSGTTCQGWTNQLEVINISNPSNPQLVKTYQMTNPHGLSIRNNTLFICDGSAGLKIYDATDKLKIDENMIKQFQNIQTFDVIALSSLLMMIGDDGLYQYDYSDLSDIKQISKIPVVK